jgi:hypothetical protein
MNETAVRALIEEYLGTLDGVCPIEYYATRRDVAAVELSQFMAWVSMASGHAIRSSELLQSERCGK